MLSLTTLQKVNLLRNSPLFDSLIPFLNHDGSVNQRRHTLTKGLAKSNSNQLDQHLKCSMNIISRDESQRNESSIKC